LIGGHLSLRDLLHDALVSLPVLRKEDRDLPDSLNVAVHVFTLDVDTTVRRLVNLLDLGLLGLPHGLHHLLLLAGRHAAEVLLINEHLLRLLRLETHLGVVHLGGPLLLSLVERLLARLVPGLNRHLHWHGLARCARVLLLVLTAHAAVSLVARELALILLLTAALVLILLATARVHLLLLEL